MKTTKNKKVSVIVPCYNEEESVELFYDEINRVFKEIKQQNYELIFVDDGSNDATLKIIEKLAQKDKHIVYFSFSRNFGKESAMYAGLKNATGDYIGFIDADLQHPPVLLKEMISLLNTNEYDCVACKRVNRDGDSKIRTFFAKTFYKLINKISDVEMIDGAGDYRLMNRKMANAIISMSEYNRFSKGIFSWVGFNTYWIEYENVDRIAGKTSWSFYSLIKYAIGGIVSFSNLPLSIAMWAGLVFALIAFLYLIFVVIKFFLYGDPVQGWVTTICVILIIGSIQLFVIGIMGQYLGKTYMEIKGRPHYIVSKTNKKNNS